MATADFTIRDVLAWARTKPADGRYSYGDNFDCALCQFLRETGRCENPQVGGYDWHEVGDYENAREIPEPLQSALIAQTFGGLIERLEKLCPELIVTQSNWSAIDAYLEHIESIEA